MIAVTESDYKQYYTYDKVNDYIILNYYNIILLTKIFWLSSE